MYISSNEQVVGIKVQKEGNDVVRSTQRPSEAEYVVQSTPNQVLYFLRCYAYSTIQIQNTKTKKRCYVGFLVTLIEWFLTQHFGFLIYE